MPKKTADLMVH